MEGRGCVVVCEERRDEKRFILSNPRTKDQREGSPISDTISDNKKRAVKPRPDEEINDSGDGTQSWLKVASSPPHSVWVSKPRCVWRAKLLHIIRPPPMTWLQSFTEQPQLMRGTRALFCYILGYVILLCDEKIFRIF